MRTPATDDGRVFVGTQAMYMHAVHLSDGSVAWTQGPLDGAGLIGYYPIVVGSVVLDRPVAATSEYSGKHQSRWTRRPHIRLDIQRK